MLIGLEERDGGVYFLDDDERADIRAGVEEARRGEFANDEAIAAILAPRR